MPISGFTEWATSEKLIHSSPLEQLSDRCIAIEAQDFVSKILTDDAIKEPVSAAIGGIPYTLESSITRRIDLYRTAGIKPLFIFDGLLSNGQQVKVENKVRSAPRIEEAWDLYNTNNIDRAISTFGTLTTVDLDKICRHVQLLFHRHEIPFLVAPYDSRAQMAEMENTLFVDAILGPSELLFYPCSRVILSIEFEKKTFTWTSRGECIDRLASGTQGLFVETLLLAGSDLLPTLPQLEIDPLHLPKIKAAAELLKRSGMNGNMICLQSQHDFVMQQMNYLDNFRKALMSIQHHVVVSEDGKIGPWMREIAPNDVHAFIGQRLPDEVYYYLSRGLIGTRTLLWRTSGQILEAPPLDGGVSKSYQDLVGTGLLPVRTQSLSLLSQYLHRFYQHMDVSLKTWTSSDVKMLGVQDVGGDQKQILTNWHVKQDNISVIKQPDQNPLEFVVECLNSSDYAASTMTNKTKVLNTLDEIRCNTLWIYLSLRGYISGSHQLTTLGKILSKAYTFASSKGVSPDQYVEPILLGMEMLRLGVLASDTTIDKASYPLTSPTSPTADQKYISLLSRVASLATLNHKPEVGYSGPLCRPALSFQSMISAVRSSQRDLIETTFTVLLLNGDIDRRMAEKDLREVGFTLPFFNDTDCTLGIAVKQYLDEIASNGSTTQSAKQTARQKGQKSWFPQAVDFSASIDVAFNLFDCLEVVVQDLPIDVISKEMKAEWKAVKLWLQERR